ncbi:MAG: phosphoribosylamine--glycine ligase [Saprospiraceae bacterium]
MNILVLGGGGREHALAWKLRQSPLCNELFIAPGNAGTAAVGRNVNLSPNDFKRVGQFVMQEKVDLVLVGPEEPLVRGIYDFFQRDMFLRNIPVIGPSAEGAQLEGSKAYAKQFMADFGIPTAGYREFTHENVAEGIEYIAQQTPPIVLKADGLAAGKGVLILDNIAEAQRELKAMLEGKFGQASSKVVIEAFLDGIEFSVFVLTDGKSYKILPVAKDYKRIGEGDTGLNTGGMGAVSPVPFVTDELMEMVERDIVQPTMRGLQERKIVYQGFIFIGLILVNGKPYVIEYNCRMGDPETEVVIPRVKNDLVGVLQQVAKGQLAQVNIQIDERVATTVMLVSGGYPEAYEKGEIISGVDAVKDSIVFHAGTKQTEEGVATNGGRVMAVTSYGKTLSEALALSMKNAEQIDFNKKNYRRDIGFDL